MVWPRVWHAGAFAKMLCCKIKILRSKFGGYTAHHLPHPDTSAKIQLRSVQRAERPVNLGFFAFLDVQGCPEATLDSRFLTEAFLGALREAADARPPTRSHSLAFSLSNSSQIPAISPAPSTEVVVWRNHRKHGLRFGGDDRHPHSRNYFHLGLRHHPLKVVAVREHADCAGVSLR